MENNLQDAKISGAGSLGGGKYKDVKISGAGNVNGDIECNEFSTSGASNVNGNVKAKTVKVSGATDIKGNIEAEEIKVSGGAELRGNVKTKEIKISGATKIKGSLSAETVSISGSVNISEDCEAESFTAKGGFDIGGLLNADTIEISIGGRCRAREIGGGKIDVRKFGGNFLAEMLKYIFVQGETLVTSVIEGDDIYLESTTAKIVRGNNVTIGPNCNIEIVEYRNTVIVDKESKVATKKID